MFSARKVFREMVPFCEMEEKHEVDLGTGYKNKDACSSTQLRPRWSSLRQQGTQDGTTDAERKEEELFMVVCYDPWHCSCTK